MKRITTNLFFLVLLLLSGELPSQQLIYDQAGVHQLERRVYDWNGSWDPYLPLTQVPYFYEWPFTSNRDYRLGGDKTLKIPEAEAAYLYQYSFLPTLQKEDSTTQKMAGSMTTKLIAMGSGDLDLLYTMNYAENINHNITCLENLQTAFLKSSGRKDLYLEGQTEIECTEQQVSIIHESLLPHEDRIRAYEQILKETENQICFWGRLLKVQILQNKLS